MSLNRVATSAIAKAIAFVVLLIIWGCGGAPTEGNSGPLYKVTAVLISDSKNTVTACYFVAFSEPPQCPIGIDVVGLSMRDISGSHQYPNGLTVAPATTLVGKWTGTALEVTQTPKPGSPAPRDYGGAGSSEPSGSLLATQQRLLTDKEQLRSRDIFLMETGFTGDGSLYVVVAFADDSARTYIQDHYGPARVFGWLQPA